MRAITLFQQDHRKIRLPSWPESDYVQVADKGPVDYRVSWLRLVSGSKATWVFPYMLDFSDDWEPFLPQDLAQDSA